MPFDPNGEIRRTPSAPRPANTPPPSRPPPRAPEYQPAGTNVGGIVILAIVVLFVVAAVFGSQRGEELPPRARQPAGETAPPVVDSSVVSPPSMTEIPPAAPVVCGNDDHLCVFSSPDSTLEGVSVDTGAAVAEWHSAGSDWKFVRLANGPSGYIHARDLDRVSLPLPVGADRVIAP